MSAPKKKAATPAAQPASTPRQTAAFDWEKFLKLKAVTDPLLSGAVFPLPLRDFRALAGVLMLVVLLCFGNSAMNGYAVDDNMVINSNTHTLNGFKGIPKLLFKDTQHGYVAHLHGGVEKDPEKGTVTYYRPLSLVTFAIEIGVLGYDKEGGWRANVSHVINILLYGATVYLLFYIFYHYMFGSQPAIAFLAALLFAVHPLHTEVVANIKGRDEIMALFFLALTLYYSFAYFLNDPAKRTRNLMLTLLFFGLAYLSKENSITFMAVIPLTLYCFLPNGEKKVGEILRFMAPLLVLTVAYLLFRASVTTVALARDQQNILYNRFARSSFAEKYATCFYILWFYVSLLFYPHPLSWDYNYRAIDFYTFADPIVWFSILLHAGLFIWAALKLREKNVIAYGLMFYFITLSIVSNMVIDIGGFVGERFLYQPSVGFSIAVAALLVKGYQKLPALPSAAKAGAVWVLVLAACGLATAKDIDRNAEWKDNRTLFYIDALNWPNSAKCLMACGSSLMKDAEATKAKDKAKGLADFRVALDYFTRAIKIEGHFDSYLNMGEIYFHLEKYDSAAYYWKLAQDINALHPKVIEYYEMMPNMTRDYGLLAYKRSLPEKPNMARTPLQQASLDTCNFYFGLHAKYYEPKKDAQWYTMGQFFATQEDLEKAAFAFEMAARANPNKAQYWSDFGGCSYMLKRYDVAARAFEKCLALEPNRQQERNGLNAARAMMQRQPAETQQPLIQIP